MWPLIRKLLFLIEPEDAHSLAKWGMRLMARTLHLTIDTVNNPICLAAGFDKNAELIDVLPFFGFGSIEIGTVTPLPQGGNERPRLFRNPADQTIFNRMGFNNLGAGIISERVRAAKKKVPEGFRIGVNLGKNKNTPDADAALDYAKAARPFLDTADYFVINVSSPNTPGLRALQTPEALQKIVKEVKSVIAEGTRMIPLWVKLAPEVTGTPLQEVVRALETAGIDGLILTNTLGGHYIYRGNELAGGWSGQNLTSLSLERLREVKAMTRLPVVSVGGIMTVKDALERLKAGAAGIQLYTGWIYAGPFFAKHILKAIRRSS
ncbi:MAG: quinone-dependent dihydroorotate dehydrogenase [Proteobacteria bacterium]|nr:quinone-dependent dihydroorotate dehydrogenase [Pseudomonadota bacterium]